METCTTLAPVRPARPSRVYLDVTNRCQLRCRHCCSASGRAFPDELSVDELLSVVRQVRGMGVTNLVLSGGEPLMRRELPRLLEFAVSENLKVTILTNGLLIDDEWTGRLVQWGIRVKISLDGAVAGTHDFLRGSGAFEKTCVVLRRLVAAGAKDTAVHFTVHRRNLGELDALPSLLESLGIRNVVIGTIKPSGRALVNEALLIPPGMVPYVQQRVSALKRRVEVTVQHFSDKGWEGFGCPAVCNKLGITANGRLTTCAFFGEEMLGDSIRSYSLEELWELHLARGSVFEANEDCRACSSLARCGGGCRARAVYYHGDINAPDPYCCAFHEKKIMINDNRVLLQAAVKDTLQAFTTGGRPLA